MSPWARVLLRGILLLTFAVAARADPLQAILLVAKPSILDPNFRQSVVLVTRTPDGSTVGVILNRPTELKLGDMLHDNENATGYTDRVYFGGPVLPRTVVALFHSSGQPGGPAFPVLEDVYLSMHPAVIEPLLASSRNDYRLFAGFAGWSSRQLENEIARDDWYVLPARVSLLFRKDTASLWRELVDQASGARTQCSPLYYVHEIRASSPAFSRTAALLPAGPCAGGCDAPDRASGLP